MWNQHEYAVTCLLFESLHETHHASVWDGVCSWSHPWKNHEGFSLQTTCICTRSLGVVLSDRHRDPYVIQSGHWKQAGVGGRVRGRRDVQRDVSCQSLLCSVWTSKNTLGDLLPYAGWKGQADLRSVVRTFRSCWVEARDKEKKKRRKLS